jgi:hypothetical protein
MKNFIRRGMSLVLAVLLLTSPLMALTAEAGNGKSRGRGKSHKSRVYKDRSHGRDRHDDHVYADNSTSRHRSGSTSHRSHRESRRSGSSHHKHSREHNESAIVPFIGGLVIGAIISNAANSSSRHDRHYVYDCDPCGSHYRSYDRWQGHLVSYHDVPSCDVAEYYPEYEGGHWENY